MKLPIYSREARPSRISPKEARCRTLPRINHKETNPLLVYWR